MPEKKEKRTQLIEIIALPPLSMVLVHAKDVHVDKVALATVIRKIALETITPKKDVDPQTVKKIVEYLEKKS